MTVGPEFHINTEVILDQDQPEVASQPVANGRSVVVWQDQFSADRRHGHQGPASTTGPATRSAARSSSPTARGRRRARGGHGRPGQLRRDLDRNVVGTNNNIKAQRFFANGAKNGAVILVATGGPAGVRLQRGHGPGGQLRGQLHGPSPSPTVAGRHGPPLREQRQLALGVRRWRAPSGSESGSSVARSPDGRFSIAYTRGGANENRAEAVQRRGRVDRQPRLGTDAQGRVSPDVAMDRFGNTVVVWAAPARRLRPRHHGPEGVQQRLRGPADVRGQFGGPGVLADGGDGPERRRFRRLLQPARATNGLQQPRSSAR